MQRQGTGPAQNLWFMVPPAAGGYSAWIPWTLARLVQGAFCGKKLSNTRQGAPALFYTLRRNLEEFQRFVV